MPELNQNEQNVQPGAVIGPQGAMQPQAAPVSQQVAQATPASAEPVQAPAAVDPIPQPVYEQPPQPQQQSNTNDNYTWSAVEFVAHHKTMRWFVAFAAVSFVIIAIVFFITKDVTAVAALTVGAIAVGIYAGRVPRAQQFTINADGFSVGARHFDFHQFKSFSVVHEGDVSSVQFLPLKRFSLYTTIYYAPEHEDVILDYVENALPFVENGGDPIDRLLRRVRF